MSISTETVRKTFNISQENANKMLEYIPSRKQTHFVNKALRNEFKRMEDEMKRKQLIEKMKNIKRIKSDESIVDTIYKMREEREARIQ